jgi:hypothetical protein
VIPEERPPHHLPPPALQNNHCNKNISHVFMSVIAKTTDFQICLQSGQFAVQQKRIS